MSGLVGTLFNEIADDIQIQRLLGTIESDDDTVLGKVIFFKKDKPTETYMKLCDSTGLVSNFTHSNCFRNGQYNFKIKVVFSNDNCKKLTDYTCLRDCLAIYLHKCNFVHELEIIRSGSILLGEDMRHSFTLNVRAHV